MWIEREADERLFTDPTSRTDRFSYFFIFVFVGLEEKAFFEQRTERNIVLLRSDARLDDISFLQRFESIVKNISFGLTTPTCVSQRFSRIDFVLPSSFEGFP